MSKRQWTHAQKTAIEHVGGDLLVSAAAGSGKTATLAERCARLIKDGHASVDSLLVLTFTEAAANEMRSRIADAISAMLPEADSPLFASQRRRIEKQAAMVERAAISTLHSFCGRILRQFFHEANVDPSFELIDQEEAALLRDEILQSVIARWHTGSKNGEQFADGFADFYEAYAQGRDSTLAALIEKVYSMLASTDDPTRWKADARARFSPDGVEATLNDLAGNVLVARLDELITQTRRAIETLTKRGITGAMLFNLETLRSMAEKARDRIRSAAFAAWDELPGLLEAPTWKRISSKDMPGDFESLKKFTWEKCKSQFVGLRAAFLVADAATMRRDLLRMAPFIETLLGLVEDFEQTFGAAKREQNRLDFNDLERMALTLLTAENSQARAELRNRFDHLLVDEFQDINPLQAALLNAVRSDTKFNGAGNLFVVGDMKQSIYGFRLAEPKLFRDREAAARAGTESYIALAANFRSQPKLLDIMNRLFERVLTSAVAEVNYRDGHALQAPETPRETPSDPKNFTGEPLELLLVSTREADNSPTEAAEKLDGGDDSDEPAESLSGTEAEARMVAQRIAALMAEGRLVAERDGTHRPLRYRDIAILLRGMSNRAPLFSRALAEGGIPVHADLSSGYFDAPEIRHVIALLNVLDNPLQDIPLAATLVGPFGRMTFDDLARIRLAFDRKRFAFHAAATAFAEETQTSSPQIQAQLRAIFERLARWRTWTRTRPLHEALGEIYSESKIIPYVSALDAGMRRVANLQMLHQRALQFSSFRKQGLHRFLRFIDRLRDRETDFGEAPVLSEASDVVRIMSVHKSKGLEFPVVILGSAGTRFNMGRDEEGGFSIHRDLHLGPKVIDVERNVFYHSAASIAARERRRQTDRAEELRLLYVAMTRARDHLIISGQIRSTAGLYSTRDAWIGHTGDVPADVLLQGSSFLDWLVPAIASSPLRIDWPDDRVESPQVAVRIYAKGDLAIARSANAVATDDAEIKAMLAAEPVAEPAGKKAGAVSGLLAMRLQARYAYEAFTTQPAVVTVSELKKQLEAGDAEEPRIEMLDRRPPGASHTATEARARGIATHRVLELLNFKELSPALELEGQIARMVEAGGLLEEDAGRVDRSAIQWFLQTEIAGRMRAAARREGGLELRREIPFTWVSPRIGPDVDQQSQDSADWPTVRGVIDALILDPQNNIAEVVDYKTDAVWTWAGRLPEYRRQMKFYLWAAADIVGFAPTHASLVFLSPQKIERVEFPLAE